MVRTDNTRGTSGGRSTSGLIGRGSTGSAEARGFDLIVGAPTVGRRLILRPPLRAALDPDLAQLLVRLLLIVGAVLHAAAGTDRIGRRAGHVDGRLGQAGEPAHRTGKIL